MTPSQARNAIKRCLKQLMDPIPDDRQIETLWSYFESRCCYCGDPVNRQDRRGHLDHLIPESQGGKNHIWNRALACNVCNGDLKLDSDWDRYLSRVCSPNQQLYLERKTKIMQWINGHQLKLDDNDKQKIEQAYKKVNASFTEEVNRLRPV